MNSGIRSARVQASLLSVLASLSAMAAEPWIIFNPVTITEPTAVGDVIVVDGGELNVSGVPYPGFQLSGNLLVAGTGTASFSDSVIQVMSSYHGQYAVAAAGRGRITIRRCTYLVPQGVQHALAPMEDGRIEIEDSNFQFVQFVPLGRGVLSAERLNGLFECVLMDEGRLDLSDIPRDPGGGELWVWPDFPPGSEAVYSPPLPGFVESFSFPPAGSTGIEQSFTISRCKVRLWPLLVKEGADLTLQDIAEDNWVVVGFHLPHDTSVSNLYNARTYEEETLPFPDRTVRLKNASIDTWNLYPEKTARVAVRDSLIGELLAFDEASVTMERVTVDGSGGYFGTGGRAVLDATSCTFTCDVQAVADSTMNLHRCAVLPYPLDPTGEWTRLRAYDRAILFLEQTSFSTTLATGGSGTVAVAYLSNAPASPPRKKHPLTLTGTATLHTADAARALASWKLEAVKLATGKTQTLGEGGASIEGGVLGVWKKANPRKNYELRLTLVGADGRAFVSTTAVPHGPLQ